MTAFRFLTAGESHGKGLSSIIEGVPAGLPLSAGVTIYVAASDLMPEVNREPGVKMALVVFLGVGVLFLLDQVAHVH